MSNPDLELQRLRWSLQNRGISAQELDDICQRASEEVNLQILDIVSNAAGEAVSYAESIEAWDFLSDMDISEESGNYVIKTKSGLTDYTIDAINNLPNLLKNAKTAADGSRYKVIPIKTKSDKPAIGTSSDEVMRNQSAAAAIARQALRDKQADRSDRANVMVESFRQQIASQMVSKKEEHKRINCSQRSHRFTSQSRRKQRSIKTS